MISYNFIRNNDLSSRELNFLHIVDSFTNESHLKCSQYAQMMKCSTRTIKRLIQSLVKKGYLKIRYGIFKSIHLKLIETKGIIQNLFSKVTKKTFKSDTHVTSNIREHKKKINTPPAIKYSIYKHEEIKIDSNSIPRTMEWIQNLKKQSGLCF